MPNTQVVVYQPSSNLALSNSLLGLKGALHSAALANVADAGEGFTDAEKIAMTTIEELKLVNGMDLAAVLLRYEYIIKIRDLSLWSVHPAQYQSMDAMAKAQGIAPSELSAIMDLCGVIFPFIADELHQSISEMWDRIGKTNFKELVPVLKSIITGVPSETASTRTSVENELNNIAATALAAGQTLTPEATRNQAVENLLEVGTLTNREMRERIRPDRTPAIGASIIRSNGRCIFMAELSPDQFEMVNRRLHGYMDAINVDLPTNLRQRQLEAHRVPVLSALLADLEN